MKRAVFIIVALLLVLGAWGACFFLTHAAWKANEHQVQTYGVFGDSFGTVNALFSGLAFVGVVTALIFQAQDMTRQRHEFRVQARITACAAIIEAEKTLSDYYHQAAQSNAPAPIPSQANITWADMIQRSRERILKMSADLEEQRKMLMQELA